MTAQNQNKAFLWVPFSIISIGMIAGVVFMIQSTKSYKIKKPLVIKPSSVEKIEDIAFQMHRALFPLKAQGFSFNLDTDAPLELKSALLKNFNGSKDLLKLKFHKIDLSKEPDISSVDCKNTALFNMRRKKKHWKKKIFFSLCKESEKNFSLFIAN